MKQFKTESKRILDLMINSIYTNKEIFLRELISNASDAIDKLKFISLTDDKVISDFSINISVDKDARTLTVEDDGIGMTEKDLEKNLGTIAESGTLAFKKENEGKTDSELIGQFGVGFYSAFMVADKIQVFTKAYGSETGYKWESEGVSGYDIVEYAKEGVGTKIVLYLKPDTDDEKYSEFLEEYKISSLVKQYSDYIRYPIKMMTTHTVKKEGTPDDKPEYEQVQELTTLNGMVPLWKKPKSEVNKEALDEFYKSEFHDYLAPIKGVYAKIEGAITYDTLLYIPSKAPFDYYSKDYKKGLKLYSNGVMIMDKCEELIPDYFGFIRGVVDSSDLNLNISREILQQDRQVKAIANSLEKKISSELKKMLENEREAYENMFKEFGLSIKFGVYAGFGYNKDKLKDFLMFYSSKKEKLVTLSEYVKEMAPGQDKIYYACGESYEKIARLPQIEKAKDKGYEILYFKDGVDEFVAKILNDYDGKKFASVTEADFSASDDSEKAKLDQKSTEFKGVLDFIKESLGDKVKEVKLSLNLKSHPVCLSSGGEISIEMEKTLNAMPNSDKKVKADKVLEINAEHKVYEKLKGLFDTDKELLKKYAVVLYSQARLLSGLDVDDVFDFVNAITEIM
ncbi:MAG: molecular chaperone HtpG [Clostridiales bacterium]|nr:molecular chaperone HtpG [Clostridiales bacterium]